MAGTVWLLLLVYVLVNETKEIIMTVKVSKDRFYKAIWEDYVAVWNIVDWISLIVSIVLILLYINLIYKVGTVNETLNMMMDVSVRSRTDGGTTRLEYQTASETFYSVVETMCLQEKDFRLGLFFYPICGLR